MADFQAQRGDLGAGMRPHIRTGRHVDAWGARLAFSGEIIRRERVDHGLLDPRDQLAHHQLAAAHH